jgi:hypothetical protein
MMWTAGETYAVLGVSSTVLVALWSYAGWTLYRLWKRSR